MAARAECVRITSDAVDESAAIHSRAAAPHVLCGFASRKESWADVMSELSDSTDAPDLNSLEDKESEANSGHQSGGESAGSSDDVPKGQRRAAAETPLKVACACFTPPSADIKLVISTLHMFLCNCPVLTDVRLQEGSPGSPTELTAELSDASLNAANFKEQWILEPARQALAATVQSSQHVYMMGYDADAFENFYGEGFKATLGVIPTADEDKVCWDTWQWGYCTRPGSCRWRHPHKQDLVEVSVFVRKPKHR